jgi:hypothetical protein
MSVNTVEIKINGKAVQVGKDATIQHPHPLRSSGS